MAFKVDQEPLIDPVKQSKPESKFNIPVPTQIALGLATLALITAGCRPVSGGSQEPSSTPGVWEAQTNPEENIQPGIYAAQLSKEQITPEIQTAAKNGGLGEFNTLLGISAVSERPGSVPVAFHLGTTTEGHSLVIFLADGVYKILPYQVYLVSDQQGKVYFSYGIKVRGEQNKAVSFFDLYLPHLSAGEMAALTPEQIKQLVSEHLKDPNNIGAVTVDNPFDGLPPAGFTVGSTQEPSLRKRLAKFFDNFSVKQALAAAAPTATVEGLGTPTAPESSTPTLEPTPTPEPIPTLSPELTGGVEGIIQPDQQLLDQVIQEYSDRHGLTEVIQARYVLVTDIRGRNYVLCINEQQDHVFLIGSYDEEGKIKWNRASLGDLAGISGISFTAINRVSQLDKGKYNETLSKFNGMSLGTAYWSAWAPSGQRFRPGPNTFNWGYFDRALNYAQNKKIPISNLQHLVWAKTRSENIYVPKWILAITDAEQLKAEIANHILTIAEHYQKSNKSSLSEYPYALDVIGTPLDQMSIFNAKATDVPLIQTVSVVNEPGWFSDEYKDHAMRVIGESYVDFAFAEAYKNFPPGTLLLLNDINLLLEVDANPRRFNKTVEVIERIRNNGIDTAGIGIQLHLEGNTVTPAQEQEIRRRLQILKERKIPIVVTELDIDMRNSGLIGIEQQEKQAELYRFWVNLLLEYGCRIINIFGVNDSNSWLELAEDGSPEANPTLFDETYNPKLAYDELMKLFLQGVLKK